MKSRNIFRIILAISLLGLIAACNKENKQFPTLLYLTQSKYSNYSSITMNKGVGSMDITISSTYKVKNNVKAELELLGDDYITKFNKEHHTEYVAVPEDAITFETDTLSISKNMAFSKPCKITVNKWSDFKDGVDYAIPIKIKSLDSKIGTINGSDYTIVELKQNIVSNAAMAATRYSPNFQLIDSKKFFGDLEGKPYGKVTIEGRFRYGKGFKVGGNWRSDIFYGFGFQILTWDKGSNTGSIGVRLPDSKFIGGDGVGFGQLSLNKWYHFALVNDNGTISIYLDGQLQIKYSYTGKLTADGISIAGYADGLDIAVDEFRIWKTARTARQIKKYMCIVDPNNPDLIAYYKFNESEGQIAKDSTPKGNDLQAKGEINWITGVSCQ